jgi:hypothetical protein
MRPLSARARSLWRSDQLDVAMHEEMRFHIEMEPSD